MTDTETVKVTLTYAGRRPSPKAKPSFLWVVGDDVDPSTEPRTLSFAKVGSSACVIGGVYTIEATDETASTVYGGTLTYDERKLDDEDLIGSWRALDQAAVDSHNRAAAERRAAKDTELTFALQPAQRIVNKARTRSEAQAIVNVITQRLLDGWWDR